MKNYGFIAPSCSGFITTAHQLTNISFFNAEKLHALFSAIVRFSVRIIVF